MAQQTQDVAQLWIQHQRRNNKTTLSWACTLCPDRKIFTVEQTLWNHALSAHEQRVPAAEGEARESFRKSFAEECAQKKPTKESQPRRSNVTEVDKAAQPRRINVSEVEKAEPEPPPGQAKRPLSSPSAPTRTLSGIGRLHIGTPRGSDIAMRDASGDDQTASDQPRKRAAVGDGISAGSGSPYRDSSASPPPRRSKARPTSAPYESVSDPSHCRDFEQRPHVAGGKKQLWTDQDAPLTRSSVHDSSNIASIQVQKARAQALQPKTRKSFHSPQQSTSRSSHSQTPQTIPMNVINRTASNQSSQIPRDENYDIILQPETRPISQEQLVAEVKGIYAGLVMVEAKCIEVDNKQATSAQAAEPGAQPKLSNEQWQAMIALHRTLLHEHHDFLLASQHPSASPALRRLASKYAMPARMWRHGIHSFLELLRHRLPASLDHMLAFIYLAYSMMALLYETIPAFKDTWIECLGDLGRYRMAIEDDDIRDREVWTGVARHWYSKASDKAPTTGRLYHHLAILARPNALQQLFYYAKSLCVVIPFASARESILTLFEPVLNADNAHGQYRLPPLDMAFVKAHGSLFTVKDMAKFEPAVDTFLSLLDNQIGRVTRKFMEQGYHIAISNSVAMLGFAAKDNVLMKAILHATGEDIAMQGDVLSTSAVSFRYAQYLSNETLRIVLERIGDPNVLPFIHVTLVFMLSMSRHPLAMSSLQGDFPWESLSRMLNTLLGAYESLSRIEDDKFPSPEKENDARPFPEDFAMRGLLWTEDYFPTDWFTKEKIDEEEKYHELASMTAQRKERILWLACRIANAGPWIKYNGKSFSAVCQETPTTPTQQAIELLDTRSMTLASVTTVSSLDGSDTWSPVKAENESDAE